MSWHCSARNWEFFHGEPDTVELSITRNEWSEWMASNLEAWKSDDKGGICLNVSQDGDGWIPVFFEDDLFGKGRPGLAVEWLDDLNMLPEGLKKYLVRNHI